MIKSKVKMSKGVFFIYFALGVIVRIIPHPPDFTPMIAICMFSGLKAKKIFECFRLMFFYLSQSFGWWSFFTYTDDRRAYIEKKHEIGKRNYIKNVEEFNILTRLVRKTICFSKSELMYLVYLLINTNSVIQLISPSFLSRSCYFHLICHSHLFFHVMLPMLFSSLRHSREGGNPEIKIHKP